MAENPARRGTARAWAPAAVTALAGAAGTVIAYLPDHGLLAAGCGNREIARRLALSDKTVRNHVSAILLKLQVHDRTAAALRAREAGLGRDE